MFLDTFRYALKARFYGALVRIRLDTFRYAWGCAVGKTRICGLRALPGTYACIMCPQTYTYMAPRVRKMPPKVCQMAPIPCQLTPKVCSKLAR